MAWPKEIVAIECDPRTLARIQALGERFGTDSPGAVIGRAIALSQLVVDLAGSSDRLLVDTQNGPVQLVIPWNPRGATG